jgi:aryl carrier-like protein
LDGYCQAFDRVNSHQNLVFGVDTILAMSLAHLFQTSMGPLNFQTIFAVHS